jgi:integrase
LDRCLPRDPAQSENWLRQFVIIIIISNIVVGISRRDRVARDEAPGIRARGMQERHGGHVRPGARADIVRYDGDPRHHPRLHHLRVTFAVHRLVSWHRSDADLQRLLPQLSTYLGHINVQGTQRYLALTPELLREASDRFWDGHYRCGAAGGMQSSCYARHSRV